MGTQWKPVGRRSAGRLRRPRPQDRRAKWTGTRVDLIFGSQLAAARAGRSLCPVATRRRKFVQDFVAAWTKVMNADRFEVV
jgi:catalase-peroxidase